MRLKEPLALTIKQTRKDPWLNVMLSCVDVNEAVQFIRSAVEEPSLQQYSQVVERASCVTLMCIVSLVPTHELVEMHMDFCRLALSPRAACVERSYMVQFRPVDCSAYKKLRPLVESVQQQAWSRKKIDHP